MRAEAPTWLPAVFTAVWLLSAELYAEEDPVQEDSAERAPTVEEILTTKPSPDDYVKERRCVRPSRIERTEILSERLIVFHVRGGEKLLVQLRQRCPGLRRNAKLLYEKGGQRICEHDTVRAMFELGAGHGQWGPPCSLPAFEPVSAEQVEFLKQELDTRARLPEVPENDS